MEIKKSYSKDWWKNEHFSTLSQVSDRWYFSLKLLKPSEVHCRSFEFFSLCTVNIINHQVQWLKDFYQNHKVLLLFTQFNGELWKPLNWSVNTFLGIAIASEGGSCVAAFSLESHWPWELCCCLSVGRHFQLISALCVRALDAGTALDGPDQTHLHPPLPGSQDHRSWDRRAVLRLERSLPCTSAAVLSSQLTPPGTSCSGTLVARVWFTGCCHFPQSLFASTCISSMKLSPRLWTSFAGIC